MRPALCKGLADVRRMLPAIDQIHHMSQHLRIGVFLRQMRKRLCQGHHANGQAAPSEDRRLAQQSLQAPVVRRPRVDIGQLRRAAANIDNEDAIGFRLDQIMTANQCQARLFFRTDDLEGQAGFIAHALNEGSAIFSPPASLRGDAADKTDLFRLQLLRDLVERVHGAFD